MYSSQFVVYITQAFNAFIYIKDVKNIYVQQPQRAAQQARRAGTTAGNAAEHGGGVERAGVRGVLGMQDGLG